MKKNKKLLLGLVALCAAGGIATAVALTVNPAEADIFGGVENAIYLKWGQSIAPTIGELEEGTAKQATLVVAEPNTSETTGYSKVTFTLEPETSKTLLGVTIEVTYGETSVGTLVGGDTSVSLVDYVPFNSEDEVDDKRTYTLTAIYYKDVASGTTPIGGNLTLSLDYSATAA